MAQKKLDRSLAMELYRQGKTDMEIANRVGLSSKTIKYWRAENHLPINKANPKETKGTKANIVQLNAEARARGMNYGEYMAKRGAL